jgi:hypothetical protein
MGIRNSIFTALFLGMAGISAATPGCTNWIRADQIANLRFTNTPDKSVSWVDIHVLKGQKGNGYNLNGPTAHNNLAFYTNGFSATTYNSLIAGLLSSQSTGSPVYLKISFSESWYVQDIAFGVHPAGLECSDFSGPVF